MSKKKYEDENILSSSVSDPAALKSSLDLERNCIQLVPTESRANAAHAEVNKRQVKMDAENR